MSITREMSLGKVPYEKKTLSEEDQRIALYMEYLAEQEDIGCVSEDTVRQSYVKALSALENKKYTRWIDIVADGEKIGFLILSKGDSVAKGVKVHIEDVFVKHEYRRKGYASMYLRHYMQKIDSWCYYLDIKNTYARSYFVHLFGNEGFRMVRTSHIKKPETNFYCWMK